MSGVGSEFQDIEVIRASDAELAGEQPERVEAYVRYWSVGSWDPLTSKVHWSEPVSGIVASSGVSDGKIRKMLWDYPVRIKQVACKCGGALYFGDRQEVQKALRGDVDMCGKCYAERYEEGKLRVEHERMEFEVLERKTRAAFQAVLCDDRRPQECVSSLDRSAVRLYLEMLRRYQLQAPLMRSWVGVDERGRDIFAEPYITLLEHWRVAQVDLDLLKSGPDLYELARHRLITPVGSLAREVVLTRHGLINPSGYRYLGWQVEDELDGWPVPALMGKQLSRLDATEQPGAEFP